MEKVSQFLAGRTGILHLLPFERDVRSLVNIGDIRRFERVLSFAACRTGQILNYSSLADEHGLQY